MKRCLEGDRLNMAAFVPGYIPKISLRDAEKNCALHKLEAEISVAREILKRNKPKQPHKTHDRTNLQMRPV